MTNIWKRSLNSYDEEWYKLFSVKYFCTQNLRTLALSGELRNCRFRSVCWRIYLAILSENCDHWNEEVRSARDIYESLRDQFIIDPRQKNITLDDPLSIHDESQWNKFFRSQDIIKVIQQDVVRTFPEIEFFNNSSVHTSMINVLYCYSQTSHLRYRQGMHEILAPLIFVLHSDHIAYEHSCEISSLSESTKSIGSVLLDASFLEHDAYSMFVSLMKVIEPWYDSMSSDCSLSVIRHSLHFNNRSTLADPRPFSRREELMPDCSIGQRLSNIHNNVLKRLDLDLFLHLEHLKISPQMFGLRWLKLLFGREYALQDLLMVWDVVFAVGDHFSLVNHVYVSMLVHIRDFLLANDFATCLTHLMHYPINADANHIIDLALHLFNPDLYDRPKDTAQYQITPSFSSIVTNDRSRHKRVLRNKTIAGIETFANKLTNFIKKPTIVDQNRRPSGLKYLETVSDSAPTTPMTNKDSCDRFQDREAQTLPTDIVDQHQIIRMCVRMVDESIESVRDRSLDRALATLRQTRDILSGNVAVTGAATFVPELEEVGPRVKTVAHSDGGQDPRGQCWDRSQPTNGIGSVQDSQTQGPTGNGASVKTVELQNISVLQSSHLQEQMFNKEIN